jgi:hypothetical protein
MKNLSSTRRVVGSACSALRALSPALSLAATLACSGGAEDGGPGHVALSKSSIEEPGRNCEYGGIRVDVGTDLDDDGELSDDERSGVEYACNEAPEGSPLVETTELEPGETCAQGGKLISGGVDLDRDGALSEAEVTSSTTVCEGAEGGDALVITTEEPPGENCAAGGVELRTGTDEDRDGSLDDEEATVRYVCRGETGPSSLIRHTPIPFGVDEACPAGGVRIESGFDDDGSGELEPDEVEQTSSVCSPSPCARLRFSADVRSACVTSDDPVASLPGGPHFIDVTDSGYLIVTTPTLALRLTPGGTPEDLPVLGGGLGDHTWGDLECVGDELLLLRSSPTVVALAVYGESGAIPQSTSFRLGAPFTAFAGRALNESVVGGATAETPDIVTFLGDVRFRNQPAAKLHFDPVTSRTYLLNGTDATVRYFDAAAASPSLVTLGQLPVAQGQATDLTTDESGRVYVSCQLGAEACPEGSVFRVTGVGARAGQVKSLLSPAVTVKRVAYQKGVQRLHLTRETADGTLAVERVDILD